MDSPIRWAGSKRQMLDVLRRYWTGTNGRYIEPFAGSASLFFDIEPREAILGDLNADLIRALRHLRDEPEAVIRFMKELSTDSESYYKLRAEDPNLMSGAQASARFFVLNRLCFNGLYRTNRSGGFNVPYGQHKSIQINYKLLLGASALLARARLVNADFEHTLDLARSGDFVFLDPPYITSSARSFSDYLPNSFAANDLPRLEEILPELDRRGVSFAITYLDCPEARSMLANWNLRIWKTRRNIAGFAAHRRFSEEILATNKEMVNYAH